MLIINVELIRQLEAGEIHHFTRCSHLTNLELMSDDLGNGAKA